MNQISLSGNNVNSVPPGQPKSSTANIIGLCGFALFAIAEIAFLILNMYIYSIYESGDYEKITFLYKISGMISLSDPIAYLAIGTFFVMDMMKRDGIRKLIDIIGLIALVLLLTGQFSHLVMNIASEEDLLRYNEIRSYTFFSGVILLALFFAAFWGNAKLLFPSLCAVILIVTDRILYLNIQDIDYRLYACIGILTDCSMVWFMVQYMRIGGSDVDFRIRFKFESQNTGKIKPVSQAMPEQQTSAKAKPQIAIRSIATALCLGIVTAFLFLPIIRFNSWGMQDVSFYDLLDALGKMGFFGHSIIHEAKGEFDVMILYIPAIVLYGCAIMDNGKWKPIIALILTLIPSIRLLTFDFDFSPWITIFILLNIALIIITITIVSNARKQPNPQTENQVATKSGKNTFTH